MIFPSNSRLYPMASRCPIAQFFKNYDIFLNDPRWGQSLQTVILENFKLQWRLTGNCILLCRIMAPVLLFFDSRFLCEVERITHHGSFSAFLCLPLHSLSRQISLSRNSFQADSGNLFSMYRVNERAILRLSIPLSISCFTFFLTIEIFGE